MLKKRMRTDTTDTRRTPSQLNRREFIAAALFAIAAFGALFVYAGYRRVNPTPAAHEVPQTIGKFMLERTAFAEGNLFSGERHFVATYVANDGGRPRRLTYIYRRFSDPVIAMLEPKLKCSGSLENEARVLDVRSTQVGRAAYCNSSTPFFWITLDEESRIVRSDFADIPEESLKELALHFGRPVGAYLSSEPR
jgi:hypothetical protein